MGLAKTRDSLSLSQARRLALAAQGFDRPRPTRVDVRHLRRTIRRLGLVQIDFVNVLLPAHYQVLFSRLGPYDRTRLDALVYGSGEFTEQWAHEASIVPLSSWPLLRHRMSEPDRRARARADFLSQYRDYIRKVLGIVRRRGPVTTADIPPPKSGDFRDGWWTIQKAALETLFSGFRLAVIDRRRDFSRVYDLVERSIPAEWLSAKVEPNRARRELLLQAARAHGVGTAADLADYYRMSVRDARPRLSELVEAGQLRRVRVEGWPEPAYLHADVPIPKRLRAAALLSPFDPVIWFRPRAARLFEFDYKVEMFVPEKQRRWGYYVLPFLLDDRLVARVDLKADRSAGRLLVRAAYLEDHANGERVADALASELRAWAAWLGLDDISVGRRGGFARRLGRAVRS